jgi:alpha-tubulin suppressor-like RCC1 family protein
MTSSTRLRLMLLALAPVALVGCSLIHDFDAFGSEPADAGQDGGRRSNDGGGGGDDGDAGASKPRKDAGAAGHGGSGTTKSDAGKDASGPDEEDAGGDDCTGDDCASDACDPNPCGDLMTCAPKSKAPGYTCTCDDGYELDGDACKNIDECLEGTHTCSPSATCEDTEGSFECTCPLGFAGGGRRGIACTPRVVAGVSHTCALRSNGRVACWGDNGVGQIGDNTKITRPAPKAVVGLSNVAGIAAGLIATNCAVLTDGTVQCWGSTIGGASGDVSVVPVEVEGLHDVIAISIGVSTACAALQDGTVRCWGDNTYGQLGNGVKAAAVRAKPSAAVMGVSDAIGVTVGGEHACAVLKDGTAQCWGSNEWGQLGNGTTDATTATITVDGLSDAVFLASSLRQTCALLGDRRVMCWGLNSPDRVIVTGLSNAVSIGSGAYDTCAALQNGTVRCWLTPPDVSGMNGSTIDVTTALTIAVGGDNWHGCGALQDGTVFCTGNNASGQLGDDTTNSPASTANGRGVTFAKDLDLF